MNRGHIAAFPAHLTPLERQRLGHLIDRLGIESRLSKVVVFGSRARGHSHEGSDLDVAIYFSSPRDRRLERWLDEQAALSAGQMSALRLQVIPFFSDDRPSHLDAALGREGIVLWTRD